ncbi:hypothetical protein EJ110_NYTH34662 [Nymphaea thermarum]|nr:hypothetical protein EJ110_NYTH34662 [Nymphaea thermarum]
MLHCLIFGKWLHAYMIKTGFNTSTVLVTALLDMYATCGEIYSGRFLFDLQRMPCRPNVVIWGALLAACKLHGNTHLGDQAAKVRT